MATRQPVEAHTDRPWLIHTIAPEFELEDVWALSTSGGPDDLPRLVTCFFEAARHAPPGVELLMKARLALGRVLGWDTREGGLGHRVASLRERLPEEARDSAADFGLRLDPFQAVYALRDEWAAEIANGTVHAVLHLGWVPDGRGAHRGQLAVLVKPNGALGKAYMIGIRPFRHLLVYPALLRSVERSWTEVDRGWPR